MIPTKHVYAYVRTSLAIASTGVALVQLLTISVDASTNGSTTSLTTEPTSQRMQAYAKPLGSAFVIFSIVLLITGLTRYFSIQNALTLNQFPAARLVIIISSLILGALVIFTFAILVAG
ncbi:7 transmembrane receptor (rhodopsin family) domain protein [Lentinula edodes]|uniref:7 transmembrane receptor (Rhodopsin family) domain protein n=1 Tax=Lentinula edodes TaxID=5353 RepID=A0A1Q3EQU8_LENED|nr:7 transmembrane receptor (rhodopsin family) domain protein [Lentinula edodes]